MKQIITLMTSIFLTLMLIIPAHAQESTNNFKNQFSQHFNYASRVLELAKAMPADKYSWRPGEGVSSVEEVYKHIAQTNYYYLTNSLGVSAPEDVNLEGIESITGKENVVDLLSKSIQFVKSTVNEMPDSKLTESTELYGRTVSGQAVLMQLITHLSEHVGQSIAYARTNDVVPPWSE